MSAAAVVLRPRVDAWMRTAARAEQAAIEVVIEAALAREARVQAYLAERRARRSRVEVQQFEFAFN